MLAKWCLKFSKPGFSNMWTMNFQMFKLVLFFFFSFIFISWRLITLQYCSGFCHTLTWISHGFTCIPHPNPSSHLPLYPISLGLPSAPGPGTCLMHPTWAGDLFHHRSYTCFDAVLLKHQAGFRKGRGTKDQIAKSSGSSKKQESTRKISISALLTMPKPLTLWITTNCAIFFKRWEYQTTWPASWETCIQVRKQQLELDMEQQTGSK